MSIFKDINVVYVYVENWERAKKFYGEVLGWPVVFGDDEVGWFEYGVENATHFAINRWDGPEPKPTGTAMTVVFSVEDAYQVTEDLRARGVRCDDVVSIPNMVTYGSFYDLEDNRIQFASSSA